MYAFNANKLNSIILSRSVRQYFFCFTLEICYKSLKVCFK